MRYTLLIVWRADYGTPLLYTGITRQELDKRLDQEAIHIKRYDANYYIYVHHGYARPYLISTNERLTNEWQ